MVLYLDCFAGAAGDMLLAALVDLGVGQNLILDLPEKLGLKGIEPRFTRVSDQGITALKFDLDVPSDQPHRRLNDVNEIIENGQISPEVKAFARKAFAVLARAEAAVHGTTPEEVHFHEVGADDAIIDIVGFFICVEALRWPQIYSAPPVLGRGLTASAHGIIPLPGPAVTEILKNAPAKFSHFEGETVTPTGATLLVTSAEFDTCPEMVIKSVGYGAGYRRYQDRPNLLRAVLGETSPHAQRDTVTIFETNIDDMNPQVYEHLFDRLYRAGALEAYLTPVIMKKSRPAHVLSVLCKKSVAPRISSIIFSETTTIGIRVRESERLILPRRAETVSTPYGEIEVKIVMVEGQERVIPEFENCRQIAASRNMPVSDVIEAARKCYLGEG